ncbi:nucleotidyltransferase domain-containing protein [Patescibacteria group bacterium]|nr:nucleotidyltransferase domain-containing protein [Patescibacteria group bacterium]
MLKKKYQDTIRDMALKHLNKDAVLFVYGSSARSDRFNDVDLGYIDEGADKKVRYKIMDDLEESLLPYEVDVVDFGTVEEKFRKSVFKEKIVWLTLKKDLIFLKRS